MLPRSLLVARVLVLLFAALSIAEGPLRAASFTVTAGSTDTTSKTLGTASGQTGTVQATGTLSVNGSTVAVTISGNNATLTNNGTLRQTGTGRVVRDNTGVTGLVINNNVGALMQAADADVIQMNRSPASVTLNNTGTITSLNASKGGAQAVDFTAILSGANTLNNFSGGLIQATDADAVRMGVNGSVSNAGTIKSTVTTDTGSDGVDMQNNSGLSLANEATGVIEGARHGITGGPADSSSLFTASVTNQTGGVIRGMNGSGINVDGFNANASVTIVNHGTITGNGLTGDGDGIDVDGMINLTNTGTIRSLNSFSSTAPGQSEAVTVGGGTIVNSGLIQGEVAGGNTNAFGRGITVAGVDTSGTPEPIYAATTITNSGTIRGMSDSGIAVGGGASGFSVTINNLAGGTIQGAGAAAATIQTGADNDLVTNAGSIINDGGNAKTAVSLGGGDDRLVLNGGSAVIVGAIDGGAGVNRLTVDLGAAQNTFTHAATISNFSTVEVLSGRAVFSGHNLYGGITTVGGGSTAASLMVNGRHDGGGNYAIRQNGSLGGTGVLALAVGAAVSIDGGAALVLGTDALVVESGGVTVNGRFNVDIFGPNAGVSGGYGQLRFGTDNTAGLMLGAGSILQLNLGYMPTAGEQFRIVDVQNYLAVTGAFEGLAEGAIITQGNARFQISYAGGTGNDIVLTSLTPIPEIRTTALWLGVAGCLLVALRRREMLWRHCR